MRVVVRGDSMAPLVVEGQRLIASRIAYRLGRPSRGDLVILRRGGGPLLVKRVIAGPGDRVHWSPGLVRVNGCLVHREDSRSADVQPAAVEWTLGSDEYFVLGEDSRNSWDSRRFGPVRRQEISGKVIGCYWPPDRWGLLRTRA